jgi:hypothetical protein
MTMVLETAMPYALAKASEERKTKTIPMAAAQSTAFTTGK